MTSSARDARYGRRGGTWAEPIPGATCQICRQGDIAWMAVFRDPVTMISLHAHPMCNGCRRRAEDRRGHERIPGLEWHPLPRLWPGRRAQAAAS